MSADEGRRFRRYQGALRRRRLTSSSASPLERLPGDREALAEEAEGHGAQDRLLGATTRLADAEHLPGLLEADLDRPALGVAGDDLCGRRLNVRGDERDVEARLALALAHEHDAHRLLSEDPPARGSRWSAGGRRRSCRDG